MARKPPRRTAERILEASLALFNRFGEPNVALGAIAAELGISAGNLHYHFPAKEGLVNALYARYEAELGRILIASDAVRDVEQAWFFLHALFERVWQYRFLYRDLNHLLTHNRTLEQHLPALMAAKAGALRRMLGALQAGGGVAAQDAATLDTLATHMALLLSYWLSYEYVLDPRRALEPGNAQAALLRGARHTLGLLMPYLHERERSHLAQLARAYGDA